MGRRRRYFAAGKVYEVVSRTKDTLPLPPTELTNELIRGIYARALRDDLVELCNFVHMNNHTHEQVVPRTGLGLSNFYKETKKRTTEAVKRLLGMERLTLWEPRSNVEYMPLLEDVIERLVYLFCNPVRAGLVDTIEDFRGVSSWGAFKMCLADVDACFRIPSRCYYQSAIPQLPASRQLTAEEDRELVWALRREKRGYEHDLIIRPFAWLKSFGVTSPEQIEEIRQRVIRRVKEREEELRREREFPVLGAEALQRQPYLQPHEPKEHRCKTFVYCSDKELRIAVIEKHEAVERECEGLYLRAKAGEEVQWPEGVFIPWLRPSGSADLPTG